VKTQCGKRLSAVKINSEIVSDSPIKGIIAISGKKKPPYVCPATCSEWSAERHMAAESLS